MIPNIPDMKLKNNLKFSGDEGVISLLIRIWFPKLIKVINAQTFTKICIIIIIHTTPIFIKAKLYS